VGDLKQSAEIHGETPLLETQSVTLGDVVSEREVQNLPLNGRNFVQLLTLTPGATVSFPELVDFAKRKSAFA